MLDKLERKFGKYAISNLTLYILIAYGIGYLTQLVNSTLYSYLIMDASKVFEGQVWRIFTWICTTPTPFDVFTIFMFMFFYWVGTNLERMVGTFKYNVYIFSGMLFMLICSLGVYLVTSNIGPAVSVGGINLQIDTYYINLTAFLAFAMLNGDVMIYYMLVIPLKMKYLAVIDLVLIGYDFLKLGTYIDSNRSDYIILLVWCHRLAIIVSLLNFLIFYIIIKKGRHASRSAKKVRNQYNDDIRRIRPASNSHKCYICGRDSDNYPDLVFRFCSKCNGNYEYCQEHLFTHEHVK